MGDPTYNSVQELIDRVISLSKDIQLGLQSKLSPELDRELLVCRNRCVTMCSDIRSELRLAQEVADSYVLPAED